MAETTDIILNMIDKQWSQAQQSENQRAEMTNYVLLMSGAIQGYIVQRGFDIPALSLAFLMILLGAWGMLASAKYYERFRLSTCRVGRLMERLQELDPKADLDAIEKKANEKHQGRYPLLSKIRLHAVWNLLHAAIALAGLTNIVVVLVKWSTQAGRGE